MDIVQAMLMQICRLCTKEQSKEERMHHIFKHNELDNGPMLCRVTWVTNLEIRTDDGLPPQICEECYTALNQSHAFKQQCYSSDRELRHFIQNLQGELKDLTDAEIKEEMRHMNIEDHPNTNNSETSSDNTSYSGIRNKPNERKHSNVNVINCNERQTDETDDLLILEHKIFEVVSDCEIPHLEPTISIPTPDQSITINKSNSRNMKVGDQVDTADTNYDRTNSKEAQLVTSLPQRDSPYVFDESLVGLRTQSNGDGCVQETVFAESESRRVTTLVDDITYTDPKTSSKVFDRMTPTSSREQPSQSLNPTSDYEARSEVKLHCFQGKASFPNSNTLKVHLASHTETENSRETFTPSIPLEIQAQPLSNNNNGNIDVAVMGELTLKHSDPKVISLSKNFNPNVMPLSTQCDPNVTPLKYEDSDPKVKPVNTLVCRDTTDKMSQPKHSTALLPSQVQTKTTRPHHTTYTESKGVLRGILTQGLSILPRSTIKTIIQQQSVNNESRSHAVGTTPSECTSIKNNSVSLEVVLKKCDSTKEGYLTQERYTNQQQTKCNLNRVKNETVIKTKISTSHKRDCTQKHKSKNSEVRNWESSKRIHLACGKNNLAETNPSNTGDSCKSTQHNITKDKYDSAVSAGKAKFEDFTKPTIRRNSTPGNFVAKRKSEMSKISEQKATKDPTILEETRNATTEVTKIDQTVHKAKYPIKISAESTSNGNARTMSVSIPSLKHQGCLPTNISEKGAMHQVSLKLPEHKKSTLKDKCPPMSKQKNLKDNKEVKKNSNSPTEAKRFKSENKRDSINNTLSKHSEESSKSKSHLSPRDTPQEIVNVNALTNMFKSHFETAKTYACPYCDKPFKQRYVLTNHIRRNHTGETPFSCDHCDNKYSEKRRLRRHIQVAHIEEKPFPCQICPKSFVTKSELRTHTDVHNNERPFKCSMCPKAYTTAQNLKSHHLSHLGVRNFHCHLCPKAFWLKSILNSHLLTHTKEKTYSCTLCGKTYTSQKSFQYHERAHKQVRSYECKLCPATFVHACNLTEHMRKHNGDTFDCTICKKSFVKRTKLRAHLVAHSGKKPFACVTCEKTFLRKASLKKHVAKKHFGGILPINTAGILPINTAGILPINTDTASDVKQ